MERFTIRLSRPQVLIAVAYGFFLACTSVILWGGYISFAQDAFSSSEAVLIDFFARGVAFSASLLTAGMLAYWMPKKQHWRSLGVVLLLFLVGGVTLFIQTTVQVDHTVVALIVGISFGWGSGSMFCALQQLVASQKVYSAGIIVFAAAGLSAVVFFLIEALPTQMVAWISFACLVPITVGVLTVARREDSSTHPMFETIPRQRRDRCREAVVELWRPLLCIAFSAFIVGLIRIDSLAGGDELRQVNTSNMLGLLIASIILLATWRFIYERIGLTKLYLVLFPLTATAFLLLPLFEGVFKDVLISFEFLVFSITSSFMVISCARTARNQCLHPVLVYGLFAGLVYAFSLCGSLVGFFLYGVEGEGFVFLFVVALTAIYALSLAMMMQRQRNKKKTTSREGIPEVAVLHGDNTIETRYLIVVERYVLSRREGDVLQLLAKGRDVPFIAEELTISRNTVRSHIKSIFSKTGVHSRQELINLVEQAEL